MGFITGDIGERQQSTTTEGFASCTETLGSESSDELSSADGDNDPFFSASQPSSVTKSSSPDQEPHWMEKRWLRQRKTFPPPLTSLSRLCQRNFMLCPIRTDGRLEIREVKIDRPEVLCTSRENGRLTMTLHFVQDDDHRQSYEDDDEQEEVNEEDVHDEVETEEEEGEEVVIKGEELERTKEEAGVDEELEGVEELIVGGCDGSDDIPEYWRTRATTMPVSPGGSSSEGMRRCSEELNVHRHRRHPHHLHAWRTPHCVATGLG